MNLCRFADVVTEVELERKRREKNIVSLHSRTLFEPDSESIHDAENKKTRQTRFTSFDALQKDFVDFSAYKLTTTTSSSVSMSDVPVCVTSLNNQSS